MHIHMDKSPSQEFKNIFVFGTYEYLKRLEGKISKCSFLYAKKGGYQIAHHGSVLKQLGRTTETLATLCVYL